MIFLIVQLIIVGTVLYLINSFLPIDGKIKAIINLVIVIAVCLWLLEGFGLLTTPTWGHFPRIAR